jgi:hypothetical protein
VLGRAAVDTPPVLAGAAVAVVCTTISPSKQQFGFVLSVQIVRWYFPAAKPVQVRFPRYPNGTGLVLISLSKIKPSFTRVRL